MEKEYWYWYALLTLIVLFVMFIIGSTFVNEKKVLNYYLAESVESGRYAIGVNIDYSANDEIDVNGMDLGKIVSIIDSLNKTLK